MGFRTKREAVEEVKRLEDRALTLDAKQAGLLVRRKVLSAGSHARAAKHLREEAARIRALLPTLPD